MRNLAGGWLLSGIYTYHSGTPMTVTSNVCNGNTYPGQGQCMPDLNPNFSGSARINGSPGTGPNGTVKSNLGTIPYVNVNAFSTPQDISNVSTQQYLIGNAPRTRALNLNNPGSQNLDASLRRSFSLPKEVAFVFELDCLNVWNKVTFDGPNVNGKNAWAPGSTAFGEITGASGNARDFQLAAHLNF